MQTVQHLINNQKRL